MLEHVDTPIEKQDNLDNKSREGESTILENEIIGILNSDHNLLLI